MKTGQQVKVTGNGLNALCIVEFVPVDGHRKVCNFVQVRHPDGKVYWVNEKNCEAV